MGLGPLPVPASGGYPLPPPSPLDPLPRAARASGYYREHPAPDPSSMSTGAIDLAQVKRRWSPGVESNRFSGTILRESWLHGTLLTYKLGRLVVCDRHRAAWCGRRYIQGAKRASPAPSAWQTTAGVIVHGNAARRGVLTGSSRSHKVFDS